jgi:hypothetical protein
MKTKVTTYYKIVQLKCVKELELDFVLMYGLVNSACPRTTNLVSKMIYYIYKTQAN